MGVLKVWDFEWLWHGFSTRTGGVSTVYGRQEDMNLGWTKEDSPENVAANRSTFAALCSGGERTSAVTVRQVHGTGIHRVHFGMEPLSTPEGKAVLEGDGLVTNDPGLLIGIQTADCIPVMIVDPVRRAAGVFHAGWRGTAQGMAEAGVQAMVHHFGSLPADLLGAVGPGIGPCCYAVGGEVRERFTERYAYADDLFTERDDQTFLNLWEANRRQMVNAGLHPEHVKVLGECSGHQLEKYFSHRMEKGITGRMMTVAGIRPL